ncbi:MAG: SDR family oxidoreductase [Solirubrobacteraceae bacterium]|nr:SDR family oxidoreductase [Solirubrobacteraceae bacterium]
MDVAIAGGHGQIALLLAERLAARGDRAFALIRNPEHADDVRRAGAEPVVCDLEASTAAQVAESLGDVDAVVFAAGAGPGSGEGRKWTVDFGAGATLLAACKVAGVKRYVMVSAIRANTPPPTGGDVFGEYLRAKAAADRALEVSGMDWTVVRPGRLTDDPPTGRVNAAHVLDRGDISRADVAEVLAWVLNTPGTVHVAFDVVGGPVRIEEAVAKIGR